MPKTINIDFYKVVMPENAATSFDALLDRIGQIPMHDEARTREITGDPVRLQEVHHHGGHLEGDMVRTRMDTLPRKSNIETGQLALLDLDDDEGLGEETAFLYDPTTRCLTIQRNRFAVSASAFAGYCTEIGAFESSITLEPIISGDAIARLREFDRVNRLEIKVAGLAGGQVLRDSPYSLAHLAEFADDYAGPVVNIEVSMGHRKGSLVRDRVRNVVDWLRGQARDGGVDVRRIEVSGSAPGDDTQVLDLLESRIVEYRTVEVNRNRVVTYTARRNAVRAAWEAQRDRIRAILRRPGQ